MTRGRVLVVGTTPDYIELIEGRYSGRALFLTDARVRRNAGVERPPEEVEVTADLSNSKEALSSLRRHLTTHGMELSGITCFDDESLALAASLAAKLALPYHSEASIKTSRSKFHSKRAWLRSGVPCPRVLTAREPEDLEAVIDRLGFPLVLKPLTGSGSELVFWCKNRGEARKAFRIITRRLAEHPDERMYHLGHYQGQGIDPRQDVVAEEGLTGPEFSCDFILENGRVKIVRVAGKILAPELGTGTTHLYYVPANGDTGISQRDLEKQLFEAADAMELTSGLFMADFIVHRGRASFLELSPRPSGDCLPWLIRASGGLDMLCLALDLAEGSSPVLPPVESFRFLAAVRILARQTGVIERIDVSRIAGDPGVVDITLYREPGHKVALPPGDYFSRVLGHIIFSPSNPDDLAEEGDRLEKLLRVEMAS
ncbi:MAG: ATP-grasp domain-containing protein [bacterium]|nr:ATP-grasp domain-containing protein [bacterium]